MKSTVYARAHATDGAVAEGAAFRSLRSGRSTSRGDHAAAEHATAAWNRTRTIRTAPQVHGGFEVDEFSNDAGSRTYKVYVPARKFKGPRPMIVMLHGCTQTADDFAAGTQMNRLADEHGFLVVYPEQAAGSNASMCWNWYQPQDQVRGTGEPSLIAGIVGEVARRHGTDPRCIYVAGLSAGAAMAVVLGETYPELFAGVGAHSGLPYCSAHDIPTALAAMNGWHGGIRGWESVSGPAGTPRHALRAVPVIVFHGDRDHTVQSANGDCIVQQASDAYGAPAQGARLSVRSEAGVASGGRSFTRTVHADGKGQARIESWTLHGAGHAWSGGHASGSYTDGAGPDASAEMVRFFMALPRSRRA